MAACFGQSARLAFRAFGSGSRAPSRGARAELAASATLLRRTVLQQRSWRPEAALSAARCFSSDQSGDVAGKGSLVTLHFSSFDLDSGALIESSEKPDERAEEMLQKLDKTGLESIDMTPEPVRFVVGYDQVIEGLDKAVVGMAKGETKSVECSADECYGPKIPGRTMQVPISRVPEDAIEGSRILFEDGESATFIGPAPDSDEYAVVDLNHPLAGKALKLDVRMISVEHIPPVEVIRHEAGDGKQSPAIGDIVKIHFTGYQEGVEEPWECTFRSNKPVTFPVGLGETFPGLEDGILQMSQGETIFINIHHALGPGEMMRTIGVEPTANLHMKVKLLAINPPQELPESPIA